MHRPRFSPTGEKWPEGPMRGRRVGAHSKPFPGAASRRAPHPLRAAALRDLSPAGERQLIPLLHPFPSPLGEGARSADEGGFSCTHRDLPLTLALSQGRGKVSSAKKSRKLIPAHQTHRILTPVPRHSRPGLVIRGRWEYGARPVAWNHRQTNPAWPSVGRRHKARPLLPAGFETGPARGPSKSPCARCPRRHPYTLA